MNRPNRFAFIDEGEVVRRLDVDRDTVLAFVREGRLRAYPGVGKGSFYRVSDVEALATTLRGAEAEQTGQTLDNAADANGTSTRKVFDPAYKVHVRLQADLKWYDLADEDLQAWVRELHPDGYERQRTNVTQVIAKLQRLVSLMDDAASHWTTRERATAGLSPDVAVAAPLPAAMTATVAPAPSQGAAPIQLTPRRRTPGKATPPTAPDAPTTSPATDA